MDSNSTNMAAAATKAQPKKAGRKKKSRKPKDMPRRPLSAYNLFFRDERTRLLDTKKQEATNSGDSLFSVMGKTIAKRWKELSPEERVPYDAAATKDMERYRKEMDLYHINLAKRSKQAEAVQEKNPVGAGLLGTLPQQSGQLLPDPSASAIPGATDRRTIMTPQLLQYLQEQERLQQLQQFTLIQAAAVGAQPTGHHHMGAAATHQHHHPMMSSSAGISTTTPLLQQMLLEQQLQQQELHIHELQQELDRKKKQSNNNGAGHTTNNNAFGQM